MVRKNFYIVKEIWLRLEKYATERGMRVSEVLRRAVSEFLERKGY